MAEKKPLDIIRNVELLYPRCNRPYRFDTVENRSVPCDAMEDGAKYETQFRMTQDQAKDLYKRMKVAYEAAREKKWPDFVMPFDEEDGSFLFKASIKAAYDNEATRKPAAYDAKNNRLPEDFLLTSGSLVNIAVRFVPYKMGNQSGVSLRLHSIQVLKHEPLQEHNPFDEEEGYDSGEDDQPFAKAQSNVVEGSFEKSSAEQEAEQEDEQEDEPPKKAQRKKPKAKAKAAGGLQSVIDDWDDD